MKKKRNSSWNIPKHKRRDNSGFVGPSGSGKSTLAKLIAGYWDITEGNINIGGSILMKFH